MLRHLTGQNWILLYIGAIAFTVLGLPLGGVFVVATGALVLLAEFTGLNRPTEQLPPGWVVFERGPCGHPVKYQYDGPKGEQGTPTFFIPLTAQLETGGPYVPTCRRCSYVSDFAYSYRPPQPLLPGDVAPAPAI
jgi:hypothetical protein